MARHFSRASFQFKSGGKPFGRRRPSYPRKQGKGLNSENINISRFINKAVITEEADHFVPDHAFVDFAIDQRIKHNIALKGYINPTPIQDKTISHILRGSEIGRASCRERVCQYV